MVNGEEGSDEGKWREAYENEADKVKKLEVKIEELTDQFHKFRTSHREMTISTQPVQRKSQSVMRCMRCNGYGHWARECREFRCRMCNAFGHSERECSGNGRPQVKRHQLTEVRKKGKASYGNMKGTSGRLKGKCPFGELRVGGRWTKCLIDTGAEVSCMSDKCYQLHYTGMKELDEELRLTSVDGSGV